MYTRARARTRIMRIIWRIRVIRRAVSCVRLIRCITNRVTRYEIGSGLFRYLSNSYPNIYSLESRVIRAGVDSAARSASMRPRPPLRSKRNEKEEKGRNKGRKGKKVWEVRRRGGGREGRKKERSRRNHSFRLRSQVSRALERKSPFDVASRPQRGAAIRTFRGREQPVGRGCDDSHRGKAPGSGRILSRITN